jgi:hypothetical protein
VRQRLLVTKRADNRFARAFNCSNSSTVSIAGAFRFRHR